MLPVSDFKIHKKKRDFNLIGKIKVQVLIIMAVATVLVLSAQLVFAATLATNGQKVSQIEQQIKRLEEENTDLKVQIAQESSLATLATKAKKLGFSQPSKVITP